MYTPTKSYIAAIAALNALAVEVVKQEGPAACRAYLRRLRVNARKHKGDAGCLFDRSSGPYSSSTF